MTEAEAEALDMAAKAAGCGSWDFLSSEGGPMLIQSIRAHAATIMENAENARLLSMSAEREVNLRGELLRLQRKNAALKAENERLREAMTAMHKDLLLRAEIDIRDGTKIVHASNGVWLKFCAALKEIEGD